MAMMKLRRRPGFELEAERLNAPRKIHFDNGTKAGKVGHYVLYSKGRPLRMISPSEFNELFEVVEPEQQPTPPPAPVANPEMPAPVAAAVEADETVNRRRGRGRNRR